MTSEQLLAACSLHGRMDNPLWACCVSAIEVVANLVCWPPFHPLILESPTKKLPSSLVLGDQAHSPCSQMLSCVEQTTEVPASLLLGWGVGGGLFQV